MMDMVCTNCYSKGEGKRTAGGGAGAWVMGLLCLVGAVFFWPFILGVVVLGIYQHVASRRVCSSCGQDALVALDSPRGRTIG